MSTGDGPSPGITDADRERITEILHTPARVSPDTCATVRRLAYDGATPTEIASDTHPEIEWAESTIRTHVRGGCSHDIDAEPVQPPRNQRPPITPTECARIRRQRAAGNTLAEVAETIGCGESTAQTHANGYCSHEGEESDGGEGT